MRLTRVSTPSELASCLANTTGQFVLTSVTFGASPAETIRLNITPSGCTYWRGSTGRGTCQIEDIPFHVGAPSLLLSFDQLRQWQENFFLIQDCIGSVPLGNVPANDKANALVLSNLQSASAELDSLDKLLDSLEVDTGIFYEFMEKTKTRDLFINDDLTQKGRALHEKLCQAAATYNQIPELRSYSADRGGRRKEDLGPKGQRFRQWHNSNPLPIGGGPLMHYVDDEIKPLHLSGRDFQWRQKEGDMRLLSVDLLGNLEGKPVWCEVKVDGDSWTTAALVQILLYGSMIAGSNQQRRLERQFPNRFTDTTPWLGIIVEERDHSDFMADHDAAIGFCRHPDTRTELRKFFAGIHVVRIAARDEGRQIWKVTHSETIRWHDG